MKKIYSTLIFLLPFSLAFADSELIIKYKLNKTQSAAIKAGKLSSKELARQQMQPLDDCQLHMLKTLSGYNVKDIRGLATGAHLIRLSGNISESELTTVINTIRKDSNVEYIEKNAIAQISNTR